MPRPRIQPKVILSDDPLRPTDVLPHKVTIALDGDPEKEEPYEPIPPREPPHRHDPDKPGIPPDEPEEEPDIDGDDGEEENTPSPSQPGETPAPAGAAAFTLGSEYSAPVSAAPSPPPTVTYRSRISVVEAWRYPGQLAQAPQFIDRSWTAWAEATIDGKPAGPALRIPVTRSISGPPPIDGTKLCRIGDYVVRQNVTLVDGLEPEEHLDVWPKDDFERLFMPVKGHSLADAA